MSRRSRELLIALLYCSPALIIFALFTYFPFFRAIFLSLHVTNPAGQPVAFNGVDYYLRVLNFDGSGRTEYLESIVTSFQFMLMVVPFVIIISVALALLATTRVRGIKIFRTIFTSTVAISLSSAGLIWALIYNPSTKATVWLVDLLNVNTPSLLGSNATALPAVAALTIWAGIGFNFIISLAGLQAIPSDLYESAAIDGAGRWKTFRYITLPMLSPTLLFLIVIGTIGALQAFTQFYLLIPDSPNTVFVYETYRAFWYDNRYGLASAMSIIIFIILVVLTAIQYRVLERRVHYQ
ncbi:MAG: sugar ABC transporter permease [Burkholderiales bacterium]|nr:sugar ABC transporter permease [Anaerolineae bacterium]